MKYLCRSRFASMLARLRCGSGVSEGRHLRLTRAIRKWPSFFPAGCPAPPEGAWAVTSPTKATNTIDVARAREGCTSVSSGYLLKRDAQGALGNAGFGFRCRLQIGGRFRSPEQHAVHHRLDTDRHEFPNQGRGV